MRATIAAIGAVACLVFSTACMSYITPVRPPQGLMLTTITAPLTVNYSNTPVCTKRGAASTYYVRDVIFTGMDFAWGEADLKAAAANGNLKTVEYADYEVLSIFQIFGKFTVTAYGN